MSIRPLSLAEEEAWQEVLARWEDESAHQAYLTRFADLDGLTQAGRRYRAVLEERPADPVALRWREEVIQRAVAQGLAQLPRIQAPAPMPHSARRLLVALAAALLAGLVWLAVSSLLKLLAHSRGASL